MALLGRTLVELDDRDDVDLDPSRLTTRLDGLSDRVLTEAFAAAVGEVQEATGRYAPEWGEVMRLRRGSNDLRLSGGPDTLRAIYGRPDEDGAEPSTIPRRRTTPTRRPCSRSRSSSTPR